MDFLHISQVHCQMPLKLSMKLVINEHPCQLICYLKSGWRERGREASGHASILGESLRTIPQGIPVTLSTGQEDTHLQTSKAGEVCSLSHEGWSHHQAINLSW